MGLFKKKIIKDIRDGAWGHLVAVHKVDVDTLSNEMKCVEREGVVNGETVTLLRIFKPKEAEQKGLEVTGWETFDRNPELVIFEGYINLANQAHLERKRD